VIWKIYPKENEMRLDELNTINYGEITSCCYQAIPKAGPAPSLVANKTYSATAVVYDHAPITLRFSLKNGGAVVEP
jgi:hypothetical protein